MNNNVELDKILKSINDSRDKLFSLYELYNSSLLEAEENRQQLTTFYQEMMDCNNNLKLISNLIANAKKSERVSAYNKNKTSIKRINLDAKELNNSFNDLLGKYKYALNECGKIKKDYKNEIHGYCDEFKKIYNNSDKDENTKRICKGYNNQVKFVKETFAKIEKLIADYNVKKNKVELDHVSFEGLYSSVNSMSNSLNEIA